MTHPNDRGFLAGTLRRLTRVRWDEAYDMADVILQEFEVALKPEALEARRNLNSQPRTQVGRPTLCLVPKEVLS